MDQGTVLREACVESLHEAIKAEERGAGRIELCADLHIGGTTPPSLLIERVCRSLRIPVMVMIRPRGGNFVYSPAEIRAMKISISHCGQAGAHGVVFGFLDAANQIDLSLTEDMASYSQPLQVTFHKAIDETPDPLAGILSLCSMAGITRVLTSGGKPTAFEGVAVINEMTRVSAGRIILLAAGKITDENLPELSKHLVTREFHGRRIVGDLGGIQI